MRNTQPRTSRTRPPGQAGLITRWRTTHRALRPCQAGRTGAGLRVELLDGTARREKLGEARKAPSTPTRTAAHRCTMKSRVDTAKDNRDDVAQRWRAGAGGRRGRSGAPSRAPPRRAPTPDEDSYGGGWASGITKTMAAGAIIRSSVRLCLEAYRHGVGTGRAVSQGGRLSHKAVAVAVWTMRR